MFILVNKPKKWTSHDVIAYIRKISEEKKVGHAGTLDPFATGLLIVGITRQSTKKLDDFKNLPKTYIATLKLGEISTTLDSDGKITPYLNFKIDKTKINKRMIKKILKIFLGKQLQTPPMYSAKKINGKKLYQLARQGIEIKRKPNQIEIFSIKLLKYKWPELKIKIKCSSGTYIRVLAEDIGDKLGCGAYCQELERTKIGKYNVKKAIEPKKLSTPFKSFSL